jgi:hypothetical protein
MAILQLKILPIIPGGGDIDDSRMTHLLIGRIAYEQCHAELK